ncbi:hypothetical protein [Enterobacter wuhouensis]|uniref:hypothetical protein n=1 Tax=Enterobacter wuhouensis TaxID=2529381 RepID=UPI003D76D909
MMQMDYEDEHLLFHYTIELLDKCEDQETLNELVKIYRSKLNSEKAFWFVAYCINRNEETRKSILKQGGQLIIIPRKVADIIRTTREALAEELP